MKDYPFSIGVGPAEPFDSQRIEVLPPHEIAHSAQPKTPKRRLNPWPSRKPSIGALFKVMPITGADLQGGLRTTGTMRKTCRLREIKNL